MNIGIDKMSFYSPTQYMIRENSQRGDVDPTIHN